MSCNSAGNSARNRVKAITSENFSRDPFDGNTLKDWFMGIKQRIGFNRKIVQFVYNRDSVDDGKGVKWIKCPYCEWYYDISSGFTNVDHKTDWEAYCNSIINPVSDLLDARAFEVYIGCNDPKNLIVSCKSCNESKGKRGDSPLWRAQRKLEANRLKGFK